MTETEPSPSREAFNRVPPIRTVALAIAATTLVAMPTLLVGGLAVMIQSDLGFGEAQLGIAIAVSFAAAAFVAAPVGRLAERIGPRRTTQIGLVCSLASLLGLGLLADSWPRLVLSLAIAGLGVTIVQVGANVLLARAIPPRRRGLAFGAKQAAVPLASMLAGLALPLVGLTIGWQPAFLLAAAAIPLVAWIVPDAKGRPTRGGSANVRTVPRAGLLLLTCGTALASAGGNSTPAFLVPSLIDRGFEPASAGLVLAAGSLVGIVTRVSGGWVSDRLGRGALLLVSGMIAVGVVGYLGLALGTHPALLVVSTTLAIGGGWGWGGLVPLAISRISPDAPGRAMGIVQVGPMSGAVIGPLAFGALADLISFTAAWIAMAAFAILGIAAIGVSRRSLARARQELEGAGRR